MSDDARPFDLAAEFLANIAGRPEPWPQLFSTWAKERHLTPDIRRAVRVAIVRARVFHAVEGHGANTA
jgi:hypothetical protein